MMMIRAGGRRRFWRASMEKPVENAPRFPQPFPQALGKLPGRNRRHGRSFPQPLGKPGPTSFEDLA